MSEQDAGAWLAQHQRATARTAADPRQASSRLRLWSHAMSPAAELQRGDLGRDPPPRCASLLAIERKGTRPACGADFEGESAFTRAEGAPDEAASRPWHPRPRAQAVALRTSLWLAASRSEAAQIVAHARAQRTRSCVRTAHCTRGTGSPVHGPRGFARRKSHRLERREHLGDEGAREPQLTSLEWDLGIRLGQVNETPTKQACSMRHRERPRDERYGAVDLLPLGETSVRIDARSSEWARRTSSAFQRSGYFCVKRAIAPSHPERCVPGHRRATSPGLRGSSRGTDRTPPPASRPEGRARHRRKTA